MEQSELELWQRVLSLPSSEPTEEWLAERLMQEKAAYRSYQSMAQRRRDLPFPAMARAARQQLRRLSALRFLLYGTRSALLSGAAEEGRSLDAALRGRYRAERLAQQAYEEAAKRWPNHRELFLQMAAQSRQTVGSLYRVAQGRTLPFP